MLKQFFSLGNKIEDQKLGVNTHVLSQINSLEVERDILTKTISRLYENNSDLNKIQRDKLLLRYQHQLGVVIARIQKLETVSKHPDLGPLGEGLITLMDQKLSHLDQRLYELTSKIQIAQEQKENTVKKQSKTVPKTSDTKPVFEKPISDFVEKPIKSSEKKIEITTLTSYPKMDSAKQTKYDQMLSQLDSDVIAPPKKSPPLNIKPKQEIITPTTTPVTTTPVTTTPVTTTPPTTTLPATTAPEIIKPPVPEHPKPTTQLPPETEVDDDDDDDLEKIRSNILKTLSKIEQAEVD